MARHQLIVAVDRPNDHRLQDTVGIKRRGQFIDFSQLEAMLTFVSEQVYAVRHYAGSHPQGPPNGRLGFSWQPSNNLPVSAADFLAAKHAIAARIAAAIHYAYRQGGASPEGACSPPGTTRI